MDIKAGPGSPAIYSADFTRKKGSSKSNKYRIEFGLACLGIDESCDNEA